MKDVITREQTNNFNKENKYPTKMGLTHILENKEKYFKTFGISQDRHDEDYDTRLVGIDEYGAITDTNNILSNLLDLGVTIIVIVLAMLLVTGIISYLTPNNPLRGIVILLIIGIIYLLYRNIKNLIIKLKSKRSTKFKIISAIEPLAIIAVIIITFTLLCGGWNGKTIPLLPFLIFPIRW